MKLNSYLLDLLTQSGRKESYIFELLDYQDNHKTYLKNCRSFKLDYSSLDSIKGKASITMTDDSQINFLTDRIKITMQIDTMGMRFLFPLGVFLMSSPSANRNGDTKELSTDVRDVQMYDKLYILYNDPVLDEHIIINGTSIDNEIARLLGTHLYNIPTSGRFTTIDKVFPVGTRKLEIINYLLDVINYHSLCVDGDGMYYAYPYIRPDERSIDIEYLSTKNNALEVQFQDELDIFNIPNIFFFTTNNADGTNYSYVYTNSNPDSPTSTVSRHMNIGSEVQTVDDCNSLDDLITKAKNYASGVTTKYRHIKINTMIMPIHGYLNCVLVQNEKYNGKTIETSWGIDSQAKSMYHNLREAVAI
ncbi:hypothetical protein CS063_13780 [Sporanaerobium hydrogeniformans]|uniref:Uncharacterized protein n=1 Tax=Sporanaerobium hydrogeniformans TaxID=3072179 RepID=A0AC61D9N9_9FIRM|nr:hypothetical protein [Sporanaerobium hydrogeniformans]PHV69783.1 hypothetical protein CS063_13780 [Sporanaerobium hydrogeniformans]